MVVVRLGLALRRLGRAAEAQRLVDDVVHEARQRALVVLRAVTVAGLARVMTRRGRRVVGDGVGVGGGVFGLVDGVPAPIRAISALVSLSLSFYLSLVENDGRLAVVDRAGSRHPGTTAGCRRRRRRGRRARHRSGRFRTCFSRVSADMSVDDVQPGKGFFLLLLVLFSLMFLPPNIYSRSTDQESKVISEEPTMPPKGQPACSPRRDYLWQWHHPYVMESPVEDLFRHLDRY